MVSELQRDTNEAYAVVRWLIVHVIHFSTVLGLVCMVTMGKVYLVDGASLVIMKQSNSDYSDYQAEPEKRKR